MWYFKTSIGVVLLLQLNLNGYLFTRRQLLEAHSEPSQVSKMDLFAKIVKGWKSLTIFAKSSILDVCLGSEYTSGFYMFQLPNYFLEILQEFTNKFQKILSFLFFRTLLSQNMKPNSLRKMTQRDNQFVSQYMHPRGVFRTPSNI